MTNELEQRARELLAAECGVTPASLAGTLPAAVHATTALRAIAAALRSVEQPSAPEPVAWYIEAEVPDLPGAKFRSYTDHLPSVTSEHVPLYAAPPAPGSDDATRESSCWCRTCRPITPADSRFVVCPDCGNKRCPRANDHRLACTGSNDQGQPGGTYPKSTASSEAAQVPVAWMADDGTGRVIDAKAKDAGTRASATRSATAIYSIPLFPNPAPQQHEGASEAVLVFGIEIEKLLCAKLGIDWTPTGISIESLIERLAARPAPLRSVTDARPNQSDRDQVADLILTDPESGEPCAVVSTLRSGPGGFNSFEMQTGPDSPIWRVEVRVSEFVK